MKDILRALRDGLVTGLIWTVIIYGLGLIGIAPWKIWKFGNDLVILVGIPLPF